MRVITSEMRQQLETENSKWPTDLTIIPRERWPNLLNPKRIQVWRSRDYLVQVFEEGSGVRRLSVSRTTVQDDGRWGDNLTWDEMQEIKRQVGMGDMYAIEIFPRDRDLVNVANMRHIWVLPEPLNMGWFSAPVTTNAVTPDTHYCERCEKRVWGCFDKGDWLCPHCHLVL